MEFLDLQKISSRKKTEEGYLLVDAFIAKAGIQDYFTDEFINQKDFDSFPESFRKPGIKFSVLRPIEEVFKDESMESFKNKPITNSHPPNFLDAANVKKFQIGFSNPTIVREDNRLKASLVVWDKEAIEEIESGKNEISLGYKSDLIWESGIDKNFGAYDAKMINIKGNHIALENIGRAGSSVKLKDKAITKGVKKMAVKMVDGISIEFSDQALEAFNKLEESLNGKDEIIKGLKDDLSKANVKIEDVKKSKDEVDGKVTALEKDIKEKTSVEVIDALVNARVELIDKAKKLYPELETDGKTNEDIKKEVLEHKSIEVKDKSIEFVDGAFETLCINVEDSKEVKDLKKSLDKNKSVNVSLEDAAKKKFNERNKNAWKEGKE